MPPWTGGSTVELNGGGGYVPPTYEPVDTAPGGALPVGSGGWASIASIAGGVTGYKTTNFATQANGITDLGGTFSILAVSPKRITLADPGDVNPAWNTLGTGETVYFSPTLATAGERWIGPFVVDMPNCTEIVANFVCPQGIYRFNQDGKPRSQSVTGRIEITPIDANNDAIGAPTLHDVTIRNDPERPSQSSSNSGLFGSLSGKMTMDKSPQGMTLQTATGVTGRVKVRFRRTTPLPVYSNDSFIDELIIRDCFGLGSIPAGDFGDVTTVHTRIQATSGAAAVKERKLGCVVTRKVLERNPDDTFGPALVPSQNAADIICHMALDPVLGGRDLDELDVPNIYGTIADAEAYFGFPEAVHFNYAFDEDNISFEEMVQGVAMAVFCNAYRQGSVLKLYLEKATEDSTLLFNHRNKLPGSETRSIRFGHVDDNDGVELDWRTEDGEQVTIYVPADQSSVKPKKIERSGVTDSRQAQIHADRIWNRIRYQHTTTEFEATGEASQLVLNERIEVSDNTRPDIFDGYIVSQAGLVVELSQPFTPAVGPTYSMFVQLPTGTVEVIPVVGGADEFHAVLQAAPSVALALDADNWADVTYQIVASTAARSSAFLLTEKGAYDKKSVKVQAINYDARYYQNDQDHAV